MTMLVAGLLGVAVGVLGMGWYGRLRRGGGQERAAGVPPTPAPGTLDVQTAGIIKVSRPSRTRAGDLRDEPAAEEEREEVLTEIRLLLDELGTEAARMQSLKIERHELIALIDRAEELLGRVSEILNR